MSAFLTVLLLFSLPSVKALHFDHKQVVVGEYYEATIEGEFALETRFDLKVVEPGAFRERQYLNWMQGSKQRFFIGSKNANLGTWKITAIRPHLGLEANGASWVPIRAEITVVATSELARELNSNIMRLLLGGLVYCLVISLMFVITMKLEKKWPRSSS